jgi:dihydrofolate reductase
MPQLPPRGPMRKLVLYITASLDGYIARQSGAVDWLCTDQDYGYTAFFAGVDTVLMGRKTYEEVLSFGAYPYQGTRGFVFSRITRSPDANVTCISGDLVSFVTELKGAPGKSIWLVGGGEIVAECVRHDLVDEFIVSVHPIILGTGIPLFLSGLPELPLQLVPVEHLRSGLVQMSYASVR